MPFMGKEKTSYLMAFIVLAWRNNIQVHIGSQCIKHNIDITVAMHNVVGKGIKAIWRNVKKAINIWSHYPMDPILAAVSVDMKMRKGFEKYDNDNICSVSVLQDFSFMQLISSKAQTSKQYKELFPYSIHRKNHMHFIGNRYLLKRNMTWNEANALCQAIAAIPFVYTTDTETVTIRDFLNIRGWNGAPLIIFSGFVASPQVGI